MKLYDWVVWKNCKIAGYIQAYSEWDAMRIAANKYGSNIFVERPYILVSGNPAESANVAIVSEKSGS